MFIIKDGVFSIADRIYRNSGIAEFLDLKDMLTPHGLIIPTTVAGANIVDWLDGKKIKTETKVAAIQVTEDGKCYEHRVDSRLHTRRIQSFKFFIRANSDLRYEEAFYSTYMLNQEASVASIIANTCKTASSYEYFYTQYTLQQLVDFIKANKAVEE